MRTLKNLIQYQAKQDEALDEIGYYNQGKGSQHEPIKGVHDLFDFRELGMRTVDDFGIVGASVDQVRIHVTKIVSTVVLVTSLVNLLLNMVMRHLVV